MPILQMAFSCDRREVSLLLFAEHLKLLFRGRRVRFFDVRRDTPGLRSSREWNASHRGAAADSSEKFRVLNP